MIFKKTKIDNKMNMIYYISNMNRFLKPIINKNRKNKD